jgi:hypothetical protein
MASKQKNELVVFSFAGLVFQAILLVIIQNYRSNERKRPMNAEPTHKMELIKSHPSGAEEWCCPICGRRFVVQWTPEYQKTVLEMGDEYAIHNTGKGAMILAQTNDDHHLEPWQEWVEHSNFESLWEEED